MPDILFLQNIDCLPNYIHNWPLYLSFVDRSFPIDAILTRAYALFWRMGMSFLTKKFTENAGMHKWVTLSIFGGFRGKLDTS